MLLQGRTREMLAARDVLGIRSTSGTSLDAVSKKTSSTISVES